MKQSKSTRIDKRGNTIELSSNISDEIGTINHTISSEIDKFLLIYHRSEIAKIKFERYNILNLDAWFWLVCLYLKWKKIVSITDICRHFCYLNSEDTIARNFAILHRDKLISRLDMNSSEIQENFIITPIGIDLIEKIVSTAISG
jgi:hypothetical protein